MSTDVVSQLKIITQQINRYIPFILLLFGMIGNIVNCLVFSRRALRSNPCFVYFLTASLVNLIGFPTAFISRIIDGWNMKLDLTETVPVLCKFTLFLLFNSRSIPPWMIALATVNRYLVSSANIHRRQMSNLKNTYLSILFTCMVLFLVWLGVFYCFDANMIGTPFKCFSRSSACLLYSNFSQAISIIIVPVVVMLIFGFCTIENIRQPRRVATNNNNQQIAAGNRRNENSLTKMLLTQVLIMTLLNLPLGIITFYLSFTLYQNKSIIQIAIENFLFNIFLLISHIPNCISFFLYAFTGSHFRETFFDLGKKIMRDLRCHH